jgi:S-DNA-T family DNA segregation ATPase FtsK/SpoIIIE
MSTDAHDDDRGAAEVVPLPGPGQLEEPPVLDAEVVEDDPGNARDQVVHVPVRPGPTRPAWQAGAPVQHPVIAPWLADRGQRGQAARWAATFARHWALFHLVRLPIYVLKLIGYSPAGAMRVVRGVARWVSDAQGAPLRAAAVRGELFSEYDKLQSRRDLRFKVRAAVLVATVAALWIAYAALGDRVPGWAPPLVLVLLVVALGRYGRPIDRPIAMTAVVIPRVQPLTGPVVVQALTSLGISGINQAAAKNPTGRGWFTSDIKRDKGGWRAGVELPHGSPSPT